MSAVLCLPACLRVSAAASRGQAPTRGRQYPAGGPPPPFPPPKTQHLRERPYLLKPHAPTISPLVQSNGRPHGRFGRPTSPLPCTNPIPVAFHADRWPCGPAVTQYTAAWFVLGSSPPPSMSVGAPTVLTAPSFFLSKRSVLPRTVGEDLTSPTTGTGPRKYPAGGPPPPLPPPPKAQQLRQRPYLLKPHAPTISPLVQSDEGPQGRSGRPTLPLPCTNPIPLALHADR